ncbi:MAG: 2-C-methyl-D-erythritol 2,4-cyclodiphosphate synthase [Clostridiales bacterium]|nr:2-C-methyl-D-erythritol 2,4-cyclodiphosphate synthase [Clostridiales bacterium]
MKYCTDTPCKIAAVIVCAGKGERSGLSYNKVLHHIGQKTVLERSLDTFNETRVNHITVVASQEDLPAVRDITSAYENVSVVTGGDTRFKSVYEGLKAYPCDIVLIHDGARPYVTKEIIERTIDSAIEHGSGIAAMPATDTVKRVKNGVVSSLPREQLYNTQTPQTFRYSEITDAYSRAKGTFTDDAEVYESAGYSPRLVEGSYGNIKLTTPNDFTSPCKDCKIGVGYDVHRLTEGRKLILGGVTIDYPLGLLGHSDADVLTHAIMDALLSAADLPDIGVLFPDTDEKYLGISSMTLLKQVMQEVARKGYCLGNVSAVVIAQKPKLAPIISDIRSSLAIALGIKINQVNVSATTTENLGVVGEGRAIAATASCILTEIDGHDQ